MSVSPGALTVAVESGNLAKVKAVGNAMVREGWTVNWMRHAQVANEAGRLSIRNYLTRKAAKNANSKSTLKRGGAAKRRRSRRRYTDLR